MSQEIADLVYLTAGSVACGLRADLSIIREDAHARRGRGIMDMLITFEAP